MINIIKIIFITILFSNQNLLSQTWTEVNTGAGHNLWGVSVINDNTAYAVGDQGTIVKTTDEGNNWASIPSGTTSYFNSVQFINSNLGWAVGENGTIAKTTNGGTNWTYQHTGNFGVIGDLCVYDSQNLWVFMSFDYIFYSSDGGNNWVSRPSALTGAIWSVWQFDFSTIIAIGDNGKIAKSSNGGISWNTINSGVSDLLWDVHFPTSQIGYIVAANGIILKSTDGGDNWVQQTSGTLNTLYSVYFKDSNTGWISASGGMVLKTTDGGANWLNEPSGTTQDLSRIEFFNETGIAVGTNGRIIKYNFRKPTLGTLLSSNLTANSVTLNGSISSDGNNSITEKGFVISTSSNPTISSNLFKFNSGSGSAAFSNVANTLNDETTYFIRAYATNGEGTSYSNQISITTPSDSEVQIPNNGDGNGDGIVDSLQSHVKTLLAATGSSYITVEELNGKTIYDVNTLNETDNSNSLFYPFGLVEFKVNSNTTRIKIYYHGTDLLNNPIYRKLNSNSFYFNFKNVESSFEMVGGEQVATITFTIVDGGEGDYDNIVNGIIHDPGGPAFVVSANIPNWNLIWMSIAVLSLCLIYYVKR